ncbi:MAG: response regulator [Methylococcales bacterium]|jgi:two-component system, OmpR family, response regulator|nr:response regulator [Methylococcales bacterium]MBT7410394.1 response regulator [Methylococcales bacterium]
MPELKKVLYVEDEPDIQKVASLALETIGGLIVEVCSSGKEALEKAVDFDPDLLLLDVMMPEMDGPTTMAELRKIESLNKIPAVFMTAKVQPQEVEHLKGLEGVAGVISKPFDPMSLAQQLKDIWEKAS